ncbi:hypothetical protein [Sphingomonas hankyongi]|uniref:Uncharacterized protein n=1 Tax=Sphingomonas hankyongi TaxID=2908209 RepID=A0ABT0S353_9SPHN|nr:hypothetical protein [Sphingomonas hankyongi]MCL6729965.1 hypothetical protein [Sphingomonas hankyongi]
MRVRALLFAAAAALCANPAHASDTGASAQVESGSVSGVAGVNVAAGNFNQQANVGGIALGDIAVAVPSVRQSTSPTPDSAGSLNAGIGPNSFAGSSGWIAVNGVAGSGNQQANIAAIAFGMKGVALADAALSQTRAPNGPAGGSEKPGAVAERSTAIGEGAFANSSGLVQVSLIGGDRNSSANTFALSTVDGAQP